MLLLNQILYILWIFIKPNVWYSWSLKILAIKRWFPFNFAKILQGHDFVVGGTKKFKLSRHFFWDQLSKYCIAGFTAIFVYLLLSWSRRYSMKWSSNFDGPLFQQWLTPKPQFFKYNKPLLKYLIHSKCQHFFFLRKEPSKKTTNSSYF